MKTQKYKRSEAEKHRICSAIFELEEFAATLPSDNDRKDLLKIAHGWIIYFGVTDLYNETKDAIPVEEEDE